MVYARSLADAELRRDATGEETAWLREHPILWLRALTQVRDEVESHIGRDRLRIAPLKPSRGEVASNEYLAQKRIIDEVNSRRVHFLKILDRRKSEVIVMCGPESISPIVGDAVSAMLRISRLIEEGKPEAARRIAETSIVNWTVRDA